jgi:hypothetical protein
VDAKLEEIQRKAEFAEELKGLREAAQWRKLRGEVPCLSQLWKKVIRCLLLQILECSAWVGW